MPNAQSLLSWLAQNTQKEKDSKQIKGGEANRPISFQSFVSSSAKEGEKKEIEKRTEATTSEHTPGCTQSTAELTTIAYCFPACPHCQSSWITEYQDVVNGGVYLRCWSCRLHIDKKVLDNRIRINASTSTQQRRLLPWL